MGICSSQKQASQIPEKSSLPQSTVQVPPNVRSEQVLLVSQHVKHQLTSLQQIPTHKAVEPSPIRPKKQELKISYFPLSQFYTLVKSEQLAHANSQIVQHNISGVFRRLRVLNKKDEDSRGFIEWLINNQLDHQKIPSILDIVMDKTKIYIIEELCLGGSLYEVFNEGQVSEVIVGNITQQILQALQFCEEKGFIHNRLNIHSFHLQNSALDFVVKLVDYKNLYQQERINSENIYYMAPEVLSNKSHFNHSLADSWSLGIIIYYLLTNSIPYTITDEMSIEEKKLAILEQSKNIDIKNLTLLSKEAQHFLKSLLEFEPENRKSIQDCLKSGWLRKILQSDQKYSKVLHSLTKAKPMNYLQQCLLVQIVSNYEPELKIQIEELFEKLCRKKKGVINRQELFTFFEKVFPQAKDNQQLVRLVFKNLDTDKSGGLNENEFLIGSVDWTYLLRENNLQDTFNQLSLGGFISYKSLSKKIQADENLLKEQFDKMEKINFKHFKELLRFENS